MQQEHWTHLSRQIAVPKWYLFEKALLVVVVLDLALGGNGYLFKIWRFRLREILFLVCTAWVVLRITKIQPVRLGMDMWALLALFVVSIAAGAALGYVNGNRIEAILAELKPLSYFFMAGFFLIAIRTRSDLTLVAGILAAAGFLLAVLYLLVLLSAWVDLVKHSVIFNFLHASDEFIFRHVLDNQAPFVGFFYKGTFYICIAALLLIFDPFRITKLLAAVTLVAIALTLTRSLCLALAVSLLVGAALSRSWKRALLVFVQTALLATTLLLAQEAEKSMLVRELPPGSDRTESAVVRHPEHEQSAAATALQNAERKTDAYRVDDFKFVLNNLDLRTLTVGRGMGTPIRDRERIEMTYLEILYKQGMLGLSVWILLFAITWQLYRKVPAESKPFGLSFALISLFVFVATAGNTFLTGSIGMGAVFIALASLSVLAREKPPPAHEKLWYRRPFFRTG